MPIEDYLNIKKENKKVLDTIKLNHYSFFDQALRSSCWKNGLLDIELLREEEYQDKLTDSLWSYYENAAKTFLESNATSSLRQAMMASVYAGFDKKTLSELVRQENTRLFTENVYIDSIPKFTQQIENIILGDNQSRIKEEDIDPILDYTNTKDIVDRSKVDRFGAIRILDLWDNFGVVPPNRIKKYLREEVV